MPSRSSLSVLAGVVAALAAAPAMAAPACAIPTTSMAPTLRALPGHPTVAQRADVDKDSGEPILRERVVYAEGAKFGVEQKNCAIYNLKVSMLSPGLDPTETDLDRFGAILAATPLWRAKFAAIDARAMIRAELASETFRRHRARGGWNFAYRTDALPVTGETSETEIFYAIGQHGGLIVLTIAAGD